jgi:large subunit ribosomal protein L24
MKLIKGDQVMIISGKDKGQVAKIIRIDHSKKQIALANMFMVKKHQKANSKFPKGTILEFPRMVDISKVIPLDPSSSKPARISYLIKNGKKERVFNVIKGLGHNSKVVKKTKIEKTSIEGEKGAKK